ncbi:putative asparagine synthase [Mycena crocata]|nr:putative asparagine synthase [Mycena crocata]
MCGLTAVFHPDSVLRPPPGKLGCDLEASLEIIKHRGPDSRGTYVSPDSRAGLAHVRLSIIDLPTGQQPLSDAEETIHCVVTGEIYDHDRLRAELESQGYTFKTKSDSELVVQMYKRDGINLIFNLRGEFAFVLFDVKRQMVFAVRDRFGIKPLYYTVTRDGRVLFASEMKAFMALGWQPEWDIESIVHNGEFGDERTVFKGVFKLGAGYFALCRPSGQVQLERYWDLSYPAITDAPTASIETMISTIREHLVEAVRLRLRSDVPLAVYLSGGIDSATVAGIATHLLREKDPGAKLTTFTMAYPENTTTDESPMAKRTAVHLGAEIQIVNATESALMDTFEDSVWHSEMPAATFHGAGKMLLSRAVRRGGYKVVLSGEGSDEIFGGYGWLPLDYLRTPDPAAEALGIPLPSETERLEMLNRLEASAGMPQFSTKVMDLNNSSKLLRSHAPYILTTWTPFYGPMFNPDIVAATGEPEITRTVAEGLDPRVRQNSVEGRWQGLNVGMYVTAKTMLGKFILNQIGDRADMANSVESRVSFLDHHLVEYVNRIPASLKIMPVAGETPGTWTLNEKWILRQAAKPFITEEMYLRKKVPFNPPPRPVESATESEMPLQAHLRRRITQESVERVGLFDWPYIRDTLADYLQDPSFPAHGAIDQRARILLGVLSFIVLQEKFAVPTYQV